MSYIGRTPDYGFLDHQTFSGFDGVQTSFPLTYGVPSATSITLVLDGVIQEPYISYTVSPNGNNLIFSTAPVSEQRAFAIFAAKQVVSNRVVNEPIGRETFSGSTSQTLTLSEVINDPNSILVFKNGQKISLTEDYTVSGEIITLIDTRQTFDLFEVYLLQSARTTIDTVPDHAITRSKLAPGAVISQEVTVTPVAEITQTNLQAALVALNARIKELEDWKEFVSTT